MPEENIAKPATENPPAQPEEQLEMKEEKEDAAAESSTSASPTKKPDEEIIATAVAKPTIAEKIIKADAEPRKEDGQNTLDEELDLLPDEPAESKAENPAPPAEKNIDPTPTPAPKIIGVAPDHPIVAPTLSFLDQLKQLRQKANVKRQENVEKNLQKIMDYALKTQTVTNDDVEQLTGVKDTQAAKYLKTLETRGKLIRFGYKSNTFYKPTAT